jgi:hypothetical protein
VGMSDEQKLRPLAAAEAVLSAMAV